MAAAVDEATLLAAVEGLLAAGTEVAPRKAVDVVAVEGLIVVVIVVAAEVVVVVVRVVVHQAHRRSRSLICNNNHNKWKISIKHNLPRIENCKHVPIQ